MHPKKPAIPPKAISQLFSAARTYRAWLNEAVDESLLGRLYDLFKFGPTSANCCPTRVVFITSSSAKARLLPHMARGNVARTEQAPVTAIVAIDIEFYEFMPFLAPHNPNVRNWFVGEDAADTEAALRNASLQGGYFILAARALGLDCGPMSGFNPTGVNETFFPEGRWRVNFICNLGYGDPHSLSPREPRLEFADACRIE